VHFIFIIDESASMGGAFNDVTRNVGETIKVLGEADHLG
jgi:hypothetical protein